MSKRLYYEAINMAEYAMEGHTQQETAKEFGVSPSTVKNRINYLAKKKPAMYVKVMKGWHKNDNFEGLVI